MLPTKPPLDPFPYPRHPESRPFCQPRPKFSRAVRANFSQVRLMSPELREPWIRPSDPQIGWLQPNTKASPVPRRMAVMPRR